MDFTCNVDVADGPDETAVAEIETAHGQIRIVRTFALPRDVLVALTETDLRNLEQEIARRMRAAIAAYPKYPEWSNENANS